MPDNPTDNAQVQDAEARKKAEEIWRAISAFATGQPPSIDAEFMKYLVTIALRDAERRGIEKAAQWAYEATVSFDGEGLAQNLKHGILTRAKVGAIERAAESTGTPPSTPDR